MTTNEAKKDFAARLTKAGVPFSKLTARTWDFAGFGYGKSIAIEVHGATFPNGKGPKDFLEGVPKPSEGGYTASTGNNCQWL